MRESVAADRRTVFNANKRAHAVDVTRGNRAEIPQERSRAKRLDGKRDTRGTPSLQPTRAQKKKTADIQHERVPQQTDQATHKSRRTFSKDGLDPQTRHRKTHGIPEEWETEKAHLSNQK
jgi:hypothetical protein